MSSPSRLRSPQEAVVILVLAFATALKSVWALNSVGSCDLLLFFTYGRVLEDHTLVHYYETTYLFNHTPLTGCALRGLSFLCGSDYSLFAGLFRMASVVADIAVVLGLLCVRRLTGRPPWWALYLFAASPVSIIISGFHGNVDPLMTACLFLAAVMVLTGRPVWSGLLFAASVNVKALPLLFGPLFLFFWLARGRQPATRFLLSSGALLLAGSAVPLWQSPWAFIRNVLGYSSLWGTWGVPYWLRQSGRAEFQGIDFCHFNPAQLQVITGLKVLAIGSILALGWRRRHLAPAEFFSTLGAAFALLLVFAPGIGSQYMVWWAPFLLLLSPGWYTGLTAAAMVYLWRFYHSGSDWKFPWDKADPQTSEFMYWAPWTNLLWFGFIALVVCQAARWYGWKRTETVGAGAAEPLPA